MTPSCHHWKPIRGLQGGGGCDIGSDSRFSRLPPVQPAYRTCAECAFWIGGSQNEFAEWWNKHRSINPPVGSAEHEALKLGRGIAPCGGCGQ